MAHDVAAREATDDAALDDAANADADDATDEATLDTEAGRDADAAAAHFGRGRLRRVAAFCTATGIA